MVKNWKTTSIGILTLLTTVVYLGKKVVSGMPLTQEDLSMVPPVLAGVGLIIAKDHNK